MISYDYNKFYKGTFLGYCNENYMDELDYRAFIDIKNIILSDGSTDVLEENINTSNIVNSIDLHIEDTIKSINSIICYPFYAYKFHPYLNKGDTVFVFMIEEDPKKIFYIPVTNDITKDEYSVIQRGRSFIKLNNDRIILERVNKNEEKDDTSITLSDDGIEFVGDIFINGVLMYPNNNK